MSVLLLRNSACKTMQNKVLNTTAKSVYSVSSNIYVAVQNVVTLVAVEDNFLLWVSVSFFFPIANLMHLFRSHLHRICYFPSSSNMDKKKYNSKWYIGCYRWQKQHTTNYSLLNSVCHSFKSTYYRAIPELSKFLYWIGLETQYQ